MRIQSKRLLITVVYTAKQKLFKQFTTRCVTLIIVRILLFILRSRNFSSNSQHPLWGVNLESDCCLYCEAETFQAIHNVSCQTSLFPPTVVYTAKQKLFKQFTTLRLYLCNFLLLLFILRSRNFSSNSQRIYHLFLSIVTVVYTAKQKLFKQFTTGALQHVWITNCCLYCEAETFQAIHNPLSKLLKLKLTVVYTAKQKLFKQFTTSKTSGATPAKLLFILRSRNFSSNSQLSDTKIFSLGDCCLYCEAETFQAIHNQIRARARNVRTVVYTAKQKLFKQFTTSVTY